MRITDVAPQLVRGGDGPDARHHCFVEIHTDSGVTGIGEATAPGMERAVAGAVGEYGRYLVGRDPRGIEGHWSRLYDSMAWNWGPVAMTALSGIEMALWDLLGKHHDVRVCDLLGGPVRERLKLYANGIVEKGASPSETAEAAADIADRGFDLLKFIPAYDDGERAWLTDRQRTLTRQRLEAVTERVGDRLDIAVESHGVLAPRASVGLADIVEPFDPVFYEEPVPPENIDALRRIRSGIDLPVATGERLLTVHDYRDLLQQPVPADIVQPDVTNCGGISQLKKIAAMAETEYLGVAPHNSRGPVATAAAAHVSATLPNFLVLEYFPDLPPWRQDLVVGSEPVEDSYYHLPNGPGLGIELDTSACERYPYDKADRAESQYSHGWRDFWDDHR